MVQALQAAGHNVMFVGDDINDAPVLTQADVGLAMNQSTELAQQAGDAVLLQDSLHGVVAARELLLEAMKLVNSNIKLTEWVNSAIMLTPARAPCCIMVRRLGCCCDRWRRKRGARSSFPSP